MYNMVNYSPRVRIKVFAKLSRVFIRLEHSSELRHSRSDAYLHIYVLRERLVPTLLQFFLPLRLLAH